MIRKKEVTRPVFTEQIQNEPIVDTEEQVEKVPIDVPGRLTYREKYVQPVKNVLHQKINVEQEPSQEFKYPEQTKPVQFSSEVVVKNFEVPAREVLYQPVV